MYATVRTARLQSHRPLVTDHSGHAGPLTHCVRGPVPGRAPLGVVGPLTAGFDTTAVSNPRDPTGAHSMRSRRLPRRSVWFDASTKRAFGCVGANRTPTDTKPAYVLDAGSLLLGARRWILSVTVARVPRA